MDVLIIKISTFLITFISPFIYMFNKHIKGIKTKRNLKYFCGKKSLKQRFDVYYHKNMDRNELKPSIIYFHGGGWTVYSKCIYRTLSRRLANMGYVVFNVNYPLAPKVKMGGILENCIEAINAVRKVAEEYGADPNAVVLAGDSAGAHIASTIASYVYSGKVVNNELKQSIKALVLVYGVYNLTTMITSGFPNIRTYAKASLIGAGKDFQENDLYSPVNYITKNNYPPCFLASGKIDKLHSSQSEEFKKILDKNNIKTDVLFFSKQELRAMHAYIVFDGLYTNEETLKRIDKFLGDNLK